MKNNGDVQLDYNWELEPGWTKEPTEITQSQSEERSVPPPTIPTAPVKSAKGSRDSSKSPKQPVAAPSAKSDGRPISRVAGSSTEQSTPLASDARAASRMASAADGRPATAMALAYEAGSVFDEPIGSDALPFTIEPVTGSIKPQEEATFTVRFSPLDTKIYGGTLFAK